MGDGFHKKRTPWSWGSKILSEKRQGHSYIHETLSLKRPPDALCTKRDKSVFLLSHIRIQKVVGLFVRREKVSGTIGIGMASVEERPNTSPNETSFLDDSDGPAFLSQQQGRDTTTESGSDN